MGGKGPVAVGGARGVELDRVGCVAEDSDC